MRIEAQLSKLRRRHDGVCRIEATIADLPVEERRDILLQALLNLDSVATQPTLAPAPAPIVAQDEAPDGAPKSKSNTELLIEELAASPGAPNAQLAIAVFGDDSKKSKVKIRSILTSLGKQGRIERVRPRYWQVTKKKGARK